ncbi:chitinase [Terrimonas sp.]|uniref:glycoside hydrolase family 19 protein n=1 Tax=Terrimonas sp. TaxID=1914338 RepID=UPI000D51C588|nr:glycoside hydrolase family 19 protein [Terrimonas sp.]PVD52248.1 chitinase [Terrimonas sp.]
MTINQLKVAACTTNANAEIFLPYFKEVFVKYNINTPVEQLCFLAQVSHESGGLFYTEELASGKAYEGRKDLGNMYPGDGIKFKGRGLIQITGRNNYQLLSAALQADFVNNPTLLGGKNIHLCSPDQLKYAALSAGWFWWRTNLSTIANKINIYQPIDGGMNLENFKLITRRINGGYNGLEDRLHRYKMGLSVFSSN